MSAKVLVSRLIPDSDPAYIHGAKRPDDTATPTRSTLTSNSLTIPVAYGKLMLGTWQGLYLYAHRHARHTEMAV